jgi:hypothetical protein
MPTREDTSTLCGIASLFSAIKSPDTVFVISAAIKRPRDFKRDANFARAVGWSINALHGLDCADKNRPRLTLPLGHHIEEKNTAACRARMRGPLLCTYSRCVPSGP